jgi:o-succinylbenzoate synthase
MRIERLEVVPYALPFREPYVTARGRLERRELLLVRVDAEGLVGLGETAPLALRGGFTLAEIAGELEACRDSVVGRSSDDIELPVVSPQARLALDVALWDLRAKQAGVQLCELLGATAAAVECNATLVAAEPAAVAAHAREWSERGFRTFKLKVGVEDDVEQVEAVRASLPGDARLRVDANAVWTVDEAAGKLERMAPLELAEQPVRGLAELAALRDRIDTPLAADESVVSVADAERAAGVCDAATVKLAKVGSIAAARQIAELLPVYMSSALDGPVGIAAAAHVALAIRPGGFAHGLATQELFAETIAARECRVADGQLHLTGAPGLGVEIDEAALTRHRIDLS